MDLGIRLVQANARSVWASFAPVYLIVAMVALASGAIADWLPMLIIFWLKPWLDRSLLFVLSRAVFGTETRLADLWAAQRSVWWQMLPATLTTRRLSPWRTYTQPALQLEGQRGAAWRARRRQLLRGKQGAALGLHLVFAHFELLLLVGVMMFALLFAPEDTHLSIWGALFQSEGHAASMLVATIYAGLVLLLEPFYVGAGFAMYLNRRVELEAWDVEQEFRLAFA
ncbi:MAG: hypothetical protein ABI781_04010 [Burkholderiales bacterium]